MQDFALFTVQFAYLTIASASKIFDDVQLSDNFRNYLVVHGEKQSYSVKS